MRYQKQSNSKQAEVEWELARARRRGNGKLLFNGRKVAVIQDEKVLETYCTLQGRKKLSSTFQGSFELYNNNQIDMRQINKRK